MYRKQPYFPHLLKTAHNIIRCGIHYVRTANPSLFSILLYALLSSYVHRVWSSRLAPVPGQLNDSGNGIFAMCPTTRFLCSFAPSAGTQLLDHLRRGLTRGYELSWGTAIDLTDLTIPFAAHETRIISCENTTINKMYTYVSIFLPSMAGRVRDQADQKAARPNVSQATSRHFEPPRDSRKGSLCCSE